MSLRFSNVQTHLVDGLQALMIGDPPALKYPNVIVEPGPANDAALQKISPNGMVFATVGGGAGLDSEQLFDRPFISIRVIGPQLDYQAAEDFAYDVDALLLIPGNALMGGAKILYSVRSGGAPALFVKDNADRYHFTCSYIVEAQTGF